MEVVVGGVDLSRHFATLKWDHLMCTSSPAIGKMVMAEAAKNLVPVTLELGGKCPSIMTPGSVTERNVSMIIGTKMLKNGQSKPRSFANVIKLKALRNSVCCSRHYLRPC